MKSSLFACCLPIIVVFIFSPLIASSRTPTKVANFNLEWTPAYAGSNITSYGFVEPKLYFSASDGTHGKELGVLMEQIHQKWCLISVLGVLVLFHLKMFVLFR